MEVPYHTISVRALHAVVLPMIQRRAFIQRSASLLCGVFVAPDLFIRASAGMTLRIGTVTGAADQDIDAGLRFGAQEAARSAALFGWRVQRIPLAATRSLDGNNLHALVIGTHAGAVPDDIPIVSLTCEESARDSFVIADCNHSRASADERVELWHESLQRFGAEQLNDRYRGAVGQPMTTSAWLGWFAMKLLAESALRTQSVDAHALTDYLSNPATQFDGHKGAPLRFDSRRRLIQPAYLLKRDGDRWTVARELAPAGASG